MTLHFILMIDRLLLYILKMHATFLPPPLVFLGGSVCLFWGERTVGEGLAPHFFAKIDNRDRNFLNSISCRRDQCYYNTLYTVLQTKDYIFTYGIINVAYCSVDPQMLAIADVITLLSRINSSYEGCHFFFSKINLPVCKGVACH